MGKISGGNTISKLFSGGLHCRKFIGLFLLFLAIISCSGFPVRDDRPRGVYHRVRSGETLSIIARAYHVGLQELAEINNIDNPDRIETDSVIFIPDAHQIVDDVMTAARLPARPPASPPVSPAVSRTEETSIKAEDPVSKPEAPKKEEAGAVRPRQSTQAAVAKSPAVERPPVKQPEAATRGTPAKPGKVEPAAPPAPVRPRDNDLNAEQIQFDKKRFTWPVKGKVVSHFGIQPNRMYHNGIRIAAGEGAAVQAAADGLVIFSASLKDYGETIIIQHEGQYATVYSHLGVRTVRGESRVRKGDRIAFLGKPDNQEEPNLHFEVRHKNKARNPLFFLP